MDVVLSAPRMWGWTEILTDAEVRALLSPTHVGMDRCCGADGPHEDPQPHACGDGPRIPAQVLAVVDSAPRMWGWTEAPPGKRPPRPLSPTHVGMDRGARPGTPASRTQPHACGDGPEREPETPLEALSAPRMWGWTVVSRPSRGGPDLSPTHVGMDLGDLIRLAPQPPQPHACGDGPPDPAGAWFRPVSAPRMWGWTDGTDGQEGESTLSPTHVGMDRTGRLSSSGT